MSIIMGLDPASTRNMGLAIMRCDAAKNTLEILHGDTIVFKDCATDGERLRICYDTLSKLINKYNVETVCIERSMGMGLVFVRNNLIEMAATIKLLTHDKQKLFMQISPAHLKKVLTGRGKAKKTELQKHVIGYFKLPGKKSSRSEHEWDAMGITLCCAIDAGFIKNYVPQED